MSRKKKSKPELKLSPVKVKWLKKPKRSELEDYIGYVYIVTEISTGKQYIGLKRFWFKHTAYHTRKPTKVETTRLNNYKAKGKAAKYKEYKATIKAKYKGQKVKTKSLIESDWEHYVTSNVYLNKAIPENPDNYRMEIIFRKPIRGYFASLLEL